MESDQRYEADHAIRVMSATNRALTIGVHAREALLKEQGFSVSMDDFYLLHALSKAPEGRLSMGEVAELAARPRSSASDSTKGIESLGLVARIKPDYDRRQTLVVLTAQGFDFVSKWEPTVFQGIRDYVLSVWGKEHYDRVAAVATLINAKDHLTGFVAEYLLGISDPTSLD